MIFQVSHTVVELMLWYVYPLWYLGHLCGIQVNLSPIRIW